MWRLKAEACTEERHSLQEQILEAELDRVKRQLTNARDQNSEYRLDLDTQVKLENKVLLLKLEKAEFDLQQMKKEKEEER